MKHLCACGCGKATKVCKKSCRGNVKGVPNKFLHGHNKARANKIVDLTGQIFGCWKVISLHSKPGTLHHTRWVCECVCGKTKVRTGSNLKKSKDVIGCHCGFTHRRRPFEALYNTISHLAKKRSIPVELSYEDYLEFTKTTECHYCKGIILWAPFNKMNGHKLDRKVNALGYSKENCVVCCGRCNRVKSDEFTYEHMLIVGNLLRIWDKEKLNASVS